VVSSFLMSVAPEPTSLPPPPEPLTRSCPYCFESVQARAHKCRHCHAWLTEKGRQSAIRDMLAAMGFKAVETGRPTAFGLTIPGALLFLTALYFCIKGGITFLGSAPALVQLFIGAIGVALAYAFFRADAGA
jgi:hypothetical protein